jgi:hypothetical protein
MIFVDFRDINLDVVETLTREQMKNVGGGDGSSGGGGCSTSTCTLYDGTYTFNGHCGSSYVNGSGSGTVSGQCGCGTVLGSYTPSGGVSHCAS